MELIDKDAVVAEFRRRIQESIDAGGAIRGVYLSERMKEDSYILSFIDTLEVKDPYEQCVQYDSIKAGIQAHAETYSFNIESNLFNQLTKEQQKLWRKEIEQACVSGGEMGAELARDTRYKENLEVKEVDLNKEFSQWWKGERAKDYNVDILYERYPNVSMKLARHFFELGLNAQKGE